MHAASVYLLTQNNAIMEDRGSAGMIKSRTEILMHFTRLLSVWITKLLVPSYPAYCMYNIPDELSRARLDFGFLVI